jgi:hypothetical protein
MQSILCMVVECAIVGDCFIAIYFIQNLRRFEFTYIPKVNLLNIHWANHLKGMPTENQSVTLQMT